MKKVIISSFFTFLIAILFFFSIDVNAMKLNYNGECHEYEALPIFLQVNGEEIEGPMPPIVFDGRSLVPAREVFEALDAEVGWNSRLRIAKIAYGDTKIYLKIDSEVAKVNGENKKLELAPKIINDKTMIPARFVSEQLGFKVKWSDEKRTIYIANKPNTIKIKNIKYVANPLSDLIKNVAYTPSNSRVVQIDIKANEKITDYYTFSLEEPYRLVIDIDNATLKVDKTNIPVDENGVKQIRTSQFTINPDTTRVVIDLKKSLKNNIYLSSDKKHVKVDLLVDNSILKTGEYTVVIDPGHGGKEPGAIYGGIKEKNLNLDIALRLKKLLEQEDIKVYMTRENDKYVNLFARSALANKLDADLFLSIHNNAMQDTSYDGTMTLYYPDKNYGFNNRKFAQIIQKEVVSNLGTTNRGIKKRSRLAVLRTCNVPSALVEVAFMTNWKDMKHLKSRWFLQKSAEALKDGIIKSLNEKTK